MLRTLIRRLLPKGTYRGEVARALRAGVRAGRANYLAQTRVQRPSTAPLEFRPSLILRAQLRLGLGAGRYVPLRHEADFEPFAASGEPVPAVDPSAARDEPAVRFRPTVEVLIPVYNRLDQLRLLVADIEREQKAGQVAPEIRFHLLDDASGSRTSSALGALAGRIGARLTRRETNLGFLRNINQAYEVSDADIAVLLNSDIRLPPAFFSRLVGRVDSVPDAAVITVLSFSEIATRMPQLAGTTWREVDLDLQSAAADLFMQACTCRRILHGRKSSTRAATLDGRGLRTRLRRGFRPPLSSRSSRTPIPHLPGNVHKSRERQQLCTDCRCWH